MRRSLFWSSAVLTMCLWCGMFAVTMADKMPPDWGMCYLVPEDQCEICCAEYAEGHCNPLCHGQQPCQRLCERVHFDECDFSVCATQNVE